MMVSSLNLVPSNKVNITICVGSSCHLKGSYEIVQFLKEIIKSNVLEQKIILKGCFCMEKCTEGVNIKINEELYSVGSVIEMKEIFQDKVVNRLSRLNKREPEEWVGRNYGQDGNSSY